MDELILYHGDGCPYCKRMMPVIKKAEEETGLKFIRREIWNDEKNKEEFKELRELAQKSCGGLLIPAFYSKKTNNMICRDQTLDELEDWMKKNS